MSAGDARDLPPLAAQLNDQVAGDIQALTQATADAVLLGGGWLRIRMCPRHGIDLERVDPARVYLALEGPDDDGKCQR